MVKSKYYTDEKIAGLNPLVVEMLDMAVSLCGFTPELTSGYRSIEKNNAIGGTSGSSHCAGLAVDLFAPLGQVQRDRLFWALGLAGFRRVESAPRHVHADNDMKKPNPCFWEGVDK